MINVVEVDGVELTVINVCSPKHLACLCVDHNGMGQSPLPGHSCHLLLLPHLNGLPLPPVV